ncbi:uncharacterized protein LOC122635074 [Vespula pensylvanica]|uniref:Uncharacterized protein n=1 Tax=Vespula pensylvanica TaxID=30213 RepID=A0A834K8P5_VESPE|nr:uncharacterized protein LOC122635074 [Vespula pensylvanica]KAF7402142.1 hypothetical protein H0235_015478 [Vespula pensylvanica]
MDLVYIPEVLTYGSFRSPLYQDYEQPWNKNYFGHEQSSKSQRLQQKPSQEYYQQRKQITKNCHLCRENKRRSLALYIREKSRRSSCQEIHEEIEEIEEEENKTITNEKKELTDKTHDSNVSFTGNDQRLYETKEKLANKCITQE